MQNVVFALLGIILKYFNCTHVLCYWGAFPDKYFCNLKFWTLSNLCTRRKTHTFTLGILCDSWNLWGWHLWFSSGAKWIPRCWEMARIKVNKTEGAAEYGPWKETCKIQKGSDCELIGGDWYPSPGSHFSVKASTLLNKKESHTVCWEKSPQRKLPQRPRLSRQQKCSGRLQRVFHLQQWILFLHYSVHSLDCVLQGPVFSQKI